MEQVFDALPNSPIIKYTTATEYPDGVPGLGHDDDCRFYRQAMDFIQNGDFKDISDYSDSDCEPVPHDGSNVSTSMI